MGVVSRAASDISSLLCRWRGSPAANMASNVEDLAKFVSLQFRMTAAARKSSADRRYERCTACIGSPQLASVCGLGFSIRRVATDASGSRR